MENNADAGNPPLSSDNNIEGTTTPPPSNNNATNGEIPNGEHLIDIDTQVWNDTDKVSNARERPPSIPVVPTALRNSHPKLQKWNIPSVISIGPYHYGEDGLQEAQKLKFGHAKKFIEESKQDKDALYLKIKNKTPKLRKCYCYHNEKISNSTDQKLATIFLLDGCFLLHFINYSREKDGFKLLGFTNHEMTHIKEDLFLLENQLPYKVLKVLLKDAKNSEPMEEKIKDFVASHAPFHGGIRAKKANPKPYHLLHYLQGIILDKPETISPTQKQDEEDKGHRRGRLDGDSCKNVQELRKVGIHFKPSLTSYLTDISFNPHFGITGCLKLPTFSMNNSTMIIFLNLIAFESLVTTSNLGVISYLCFLDSLIDRWDDVKELQAAGIIRNFVGEQREVAQFFNNVCSKLVPNPSAYDDVKEQIRNHIDRHENCKLRKWYIQSKQKYFSSPWSFIALTAAVIGLLLTGIQAYTSLFSR